MLQCTEDTAARVPMHRRHTDFRPDRDGLRASAEEKLSSYSRQLF
jgi:hypothetical protein